MSEQICANQIALIAGKETLEKSIFSGDPSYLVDELSQKGIAPEETVRLLESMNYDMHGKGQGRSRFAEIQNTLTEKVVSMNLPNETKENFSTWIVETPQLLEEGIAYPNLGIYKNADMIHQNIENNLGKENVEIKAM